MIGVMAGRVLLRMGNLVGELDVERARDLRDQLDAAIHILETGANIHRTAESFLRSFGV